jgi:tetratricopeptide (TPR) repeat protein
MGISEEKKLLEKRVKDFKSLNSAELSDLIKKMPLKKRTFFEKPYQEKMRYATQAEDLLGQGRTNQALDLLDRAISLGYFGNEYAYGLIGDAYLKRGDRVMALEMYQKSGSTDSLKKIKTNGLED